MSSHEEVHTRFYFQLVLLYFSTFLRGQNVPVDPATRRDLEDKRRKYLEHQVSCFYFLPDVLLGFPLVLIL